MMTGYNWEMGIWFL